MTTPAPAIVPIFAAPFAVVPLGGAADLNPALVSLFLSRATEEYRDPGAPRDPLCFRSREDLFDWEDEAVVHFRREMLGGICAAVMAVNLYTDPEFDALGLQARARFAIVRPDGSMPAATAPEAGCFALWTRGRGRMPTWTSPTATCGPRMPSDAARSVSKKARWIVFSSFAFHEVSPFYGRDTRITVATNCWFT